MTSVEVPQISLQRYVDLLKRRRWQVIPVSLIGLLVGGLVAFFIPRYYVAMTLIEHQALPGEDTKNEDDPFRSIVETAQLTIPLAVRDAMKELKWPEANATGYELVENERAVQSRLDVRDHNPLQASRREYAVIRVTYKDRDGQRSAEFANTLVNVWIKKRVRELRDPAEADRERAAEKMRGLQQQRDGLTAEKSALEMQYRIDPVVPREILIARLDVDKKAFDEQKKARDLAEREVAVLQRQIDDAREKLAAVPPRVKDDPNAMLLAAAKTPQGLVIALELTRWRSALENHRPGTRGHQEAKNGIADCEKRLKLLLADRDVDADGFVPNPAYKAQADAIALVDTELRNKKAALQVMQQQVAAENDRIVGAIEGYDRYYRTLRNLDDLAKDLTKASADFADAEKRLATLGQKPPVRPLQEAQVPPRPTDPNILVVALLGCVLGLGLAIGLILLLDVVQGTFKTIDDVERGLPVPVLGGMSHLETDAEREQAIRSRRRVSLAAAAFVFLCVAVVTIFYVDATRLPPVVRDLLALVLGKS